MNISFDYYRIFYYVAKYQNVTQAARMLMCNQPNVTRVIRQLESELGCTLFVRSNRGMKLTPEGEKLYNRARIAVEQLELAEAELSGDRALQSGLVSVGATEVALRTFLLPVLNEYRRRYPGVRLNIANYTTIQAITALKSSMVDIAIVTTPTGKIKGLRSHTLKEVQEVAVCGDYFQSLAAKPITLAELSAYPLVSLGPHSMTYEMYSRWFSEHGLPFAPAIEAATADQILPMVQNNLGIGFAPEEFLTDHFHPNVFRLTIQEVIPSRSVVLLKRDDGILSIAARMLEQLMMEFTNL